METVVDWCAFLGAWLLFAGPVYQAENELDAEADEAEGFEEAMRNAPRPDPPSKWWWLLPPVAIVLRWVVARRARHEVRKLLTPEQVRQLVQFSQTATGWLLVAAGAGLIGVKETASLCDHYEWPPEVQWPLVLAMVWLSISFMGLRARRRNEILGRTKSNGGRSSRRRDRAPEQTES